MGVSGVGRPKKLQKNATGHQTAIIQIQKEQEEEVISWMSDELLSAPPKELRDKVAVNSWNRILPDLKKLAERMACNFDRDNLICYCNAWSQYMESQRMLKKKAIKDDPKEFDRWHRIQNNAMDAQRRYGALCGMSIDARLKLATAVIKKREQAVEDKFGVI